MSSLQTAFDTVHALKEEGYPCLLIGGFAVNEHGYTRNTLDLDFMIHEKAISQIKDVMRSKGFTCITQHDNVTFFSMPNDSFRIDFLMVDDSTFEKLTQHAESREIFGRTILLAGLKDILAMKIFALSGNTQKRLPKDLPDIVYLTVLNELDVEKDLLPLCARYGNEEITKMILDQIQELRK